MFRLIASNSGSSFRPALLRNVRSNANGLKLPGANGSMDLEKNFQYRNNSSASAPVAKPDLYFNAASQDQPLKHSVPPTSAQTQASRFEELLTGAKPNRNRKTSNKPLFEAVRELSTMFKDDAVKENLSKDNLLSYALLLNTSVYNNRVSRLSKKSNRDSDQYRNSTLNNDVMLKNAVLDFAENLAGGNFSSVVDVEVLRQLLLAMYQFKVFPEMLRLWEQGVNNVQQSKIYLKHNILSLILPIAYEEKRFTYDEIVKLYEMNTKNHPTIFHELLTSIGKIAIKEGDYSRGLDSLESILSIYESVGKTHTVSRSLAELHSTFIGSCRDIRIASQFFNKIIENKLPYSVKLKAPHVQALLENSVAANEPYDTVFNFWKDTLIFYNATPSPNNSRYSIVNKSFFSCFFKFYPTLTQEAHTKLKEAISTFASIKPIDEFFLNNILAHYTWNDKVVFEQLVDNYDVHKVAPSPVVNRVILKKMGDIEEFSNSEILNRWNTSLAYLDASGFQYIPIADWAALRDATISSSFGESRTQFYLSVLNAYKNFHQDDRAVERFVKNWMIKPQADTVKQITMEPERTFTSDVEIVVPDFTNLRENVDYNKVSENVFNTTWSETPRR